MRTLGSLCFVLNIVLVFLHWHKLVTVPPWAVLGLLFFGLLLSSQRLRTPPRGL